jgi:beta-glucanase (GH16 family)
MKSAIHCLGRWAFRPGGLRRLTCLLGFGVCLMISCQSSSVSRSADPLNQVDSTRIPGMRLVWADEFSQPGAPDPTKWRFEQGFVRNNELQWYQPDNAYCQNGLLTIEARGEQRPNPNYKAGSSDWKTNRPTIRYTSSSLHTNGLHAWQYGRFLLRARIDTRAGLWPAFWTLGTAGEWPANGEIDIMEYYQGKLLANVAFGSAKRWTANWRSSAKALTSFADPSWAQQFHLWRMDWDETSIKLYVDDLLLNEVPLTQTINGDGSGSNPFRQPHYVLLNLAVGGDNGGDPTSTSFPARYEIDYVRIYQK